MPLTMWLSCAALHGGKSMFVRRQTVRKWRGKVKSSRLHLCWATRPNFHLSLVILMWQTVARTRFIWLLVQNPFTLPLIQASIHSCPMALWSNPLPLVKSSEGHHRRDVGSSSARKLSADCWLWGRASFQNPSVCSIVCSWLWTHFCQSNSTQDPTVV